MCTFHYVLLENNSAQDPDSLDPRHIGFLDQDPEPRGKISTENYKEKSVVLKPRIWTVEK